MSRRGGTDDARRSSGFRLTRRHDHAEAPVVREPFAPTLPQVNLLPTKVATSIALGKLRRRSIWALVAILLAFATLWVLQQPAITQAQLGVDAATEKNAQLATRVKALAPIEQMVTQLKRQQTLVTTTMSSQPRASEVATHLTAAAAKAGRPAITFVSTNVAYQGLPAPGGVLNPCPNPDPFGSRITIGCITFSANATSHQQISEFLTALEADPWFVGPFVSSSTSSTDSVTQKVGILFTGSVGVSTDALATPLTPAQLKAITEPPAPTASASPTPGGGA